MISITCPGCGKKYGILDNELPADRSVDLICPACNALIKVAKKPAHGKKSAPRLSGAALMEKIIKTSKALPPMPQIIARANEVLTSENTGFREIGEVLETDQAMATRVIRIANSAYYGVSVPVTSVQQASALLGFQTLFELITVVSSSKMMGKRLSGYDMDARSVWRHSLSVAVGAKDIAERYFPHLVNDAFMAGLIHDCGMIILDPYIVENQARFNALLDAGKSIEQAETDIFGFDHAGLAAEYLKNWKLPANLTHAIRFHHRPSRSGKDTLSHVLHLSDTMANRQGLEKNFIPDKEAAAFVGMDPDTETELTMEMEASVTGIIESLNA